MLEIMVIESMAKDTELSNSRSSAIKAQRLKNLWFNNFNNS